MLSNFCHRLAERSFFLGEVQFPVCARCTGFWLLLIFSALIAFLAVRRRGWMSQPLTSRSWTLMGLWLGVAVGLNGAMRWWGGALGTWPDSKWSRLFLGAIMGATIGYMLVRMTCGIVVAFRLRQGQAVE